MIRLSNAARSFVTSLSLVGLLVAAIGCAGSVETDPTLAREQAMFADENGDPCEPNESYVSMSSALSGGYYSECLKFEGDDIGVVGLSGSHNGVTVTIDEWVEKEDSPGEYIGFSFSQSGAIEFVVKAGGELHFGEGTDWVHPAGVSGPEASAISFVAFCDELDEHVEPGCDDEGCCEVDEEPADEPADDPIEEPAEDPPADDTPEEPADEGPTEPAV